MVEDSQKTPVTIRPASREDAANIARLSTQLGYPSARNEIEQRLSSLQRDESHAVYVAVTSTGIVAGWVHVRRSKLVESDPEAEIGGLVVDEAYRGLGIGQLLMERAEQWTREQGLHSVYLRSNIVRESAHAFYKKLGYHIVKTQHAFRKNL